MKGPDDPIPGVERVEAPKRPGRRARWRSTLAVYDRWLRASSPVGPQTQAISRWLLIADAIGFLMVSAHLVPAEITLAGLKFESIDQRGVQVSAAVLLICFVLSYVARLFEVVEDPNTYDELMRDEMVNDVAEGMANDELALRLGGSPRVVPIVTLLEILAPYLGALYVIFALIRR